jgi:2-keto-4-pentenoate hydratase
MTPPIEAAALTIRRALEAGVPCAPIRDGVARNDAATGYAIQEVNTRHWIAHGRRLVGRKIGLTSNAVQTQMGVDQPDFGMLYADMHVESGAPIAAGRLMQPQVEGEVAFVMGRDLPDRVDRAHIAAAIDHARVAAEIVDSRIAQWNIHIVDTVADNASSGLYVLGDARVSLHDLDLLEGRMEIERRGEICSAGTGAACLGHPLDAVTWLANVMVEVGRPLTAGDLGLSGAWGPLVAASPGDQMEVRITGLGAVTACFAPAAG